MLLLKRPRMFSIMIDSRPKHIDFHQIPGRAPESSAGSGSQAKRFAISFATEHRGGNGSPDR